MNLVFAFSGIIIVSFFNSIFIRNYMNKSLPLFLAFFFIFSSANARKRDTIFRRFNGGMELSDSIHGILNGVIVSGQGRTEVVVLSNSGVVLMRGNYKDTVDFEKEGTFYYFNLQGRLESLAEYHDNVRNGVYEAFNPDGKPYLAGSYLNGMKSGRWRIWVSDSILDHDEYYSSGQKDSIWHWYYRGGGISYEEFYKNGRLKHSFYFDERGKKHRDVEPFQKPYYLGGMIEFYKYLHDNIRYPQNLLKMNMQDYLSTSFTIDEKGHISDVAITKGVNPEYDEEVERVLKKMTNWNPAMDYGRKIKFTIRLPIRLIIVYSKAEKEMVENDKGYLR